ncbi:MAG: heme o synthase [Xanthobacteraceae bacterium]|nr:heme o synthase [Xanthobacteraceae bacterium]QYK45429.1 MAG: heme o synthase [Xanthobacteraceae bacterium]
MSLISEERISRAESLPGFAGVEDYWALLKPRVMSLVVFTALVGLVRAPGDIHPVLGFVALLCIAVGAGASGALNMWWDADIDARMDRTRTRPIPSGKIEPGEAMVFGLLLSGASVLMLGLLVGWLAGALLAFTIFFYAVIYSMWLKRATAQNIVIGGAAGALPPVIGWAAVTGNVTLQPLLLFALIFVWTPPHFWALALLKKRDYERAGIPMLPNVAGDDETRKQILLYSLVLAPLAVAPYLLGMTGWFYGAASVVLGVLFVAFAWMVFRRREGETAERAAKNLFAYSILYLFLLFAVLLAEGIVK